MPGETSSKLYIGVYCQGHKDLAISILSRLHLDSSIIIICSSTAHDMKSSYIFGYSKLLQLTLVRPPISLMMTTFQFVIL